MNINPIIIVICLAACGGQILQFYLTCSSMEIPIAGHISTDFWLMMSVLVIWPVSYWPTRQKQNKYDRSLDK